MASHEDIQIPDQVPVMALGGTVLFPHAIVPLYIFEERYRMMLGSVLEADRLFAVFNRCEDSDNEWDLAPIGTLGVVRASHQNPDGTSNLALQGIQRIRLKEIIQTEPFPVVSIEPYLPEADFAYNDPLIPAILDLVDEEPDLARDIPEEYLNFIRSIDDPEIFFDMAAHSFCPAPQVRQRLLELLDLPDRYQALEQFLLKQRERLRLHRDLQGDTRDDEIPLN
jgi:Lon protease-like protein